MHARARLQQLGALVGALGPDQPWVALPADVAVDLAVRLGVAALLLDADLDGAGGTARP